MDTIDRKWRQQNIYVDTYTEKTKNTKDDDKTYNTIKPNFMHNALQLDQ